MQEIDVQDLLAYHPYLISKRFEGLVPLRELSRGTNRLDLGFKTKQGLHIVELKKVELQPIHVSQLLRYCRSWETSKAQPLASEHYLVGKKPKNTASLERALARSKRKIRLCYFGEHIPFYLMMIGRRYRPYDETIYSSNIVRIHI